MKSNIETKTHIAWKDLLFLASPFILLFTFGTPLFSAKAQDGGQDRNIVFTEIMYDFEGGDGPQDSSYTYEWVELYNRGAHDVVLNDDWRFFDGDGTTLHRISATTFGDRIVSPGEYVVFVDNPDAFLRKYPDFSGTLIDTVLKLRNDSDTIRLINDSGIIVAEVTYQNSWGGNGTGKSLEKIDVNGGNDALNWKESIDAGGTPGKENSVAFSTIPPEPVPPEPEPEPELEPEPDPTPEQRNMVSEEAGNSILPEEPLIEESTEQTSGAQPEEVPEPQSQPGPDSNSDSRNLASSTNQTSELELYDSSQKPHNEETESIRPVDEKNVVSQDDHFPILNEFLPYPEGPDAEGEWIELFNPYEETISIGGFILEDMAGKTKRFVIPERSALAPLGFAVFERPQTSLVLNNDGEGVIFKRSDGTPIERVTYSGKAKRGYSYARTEDGNWVWTPTPTKGAANAFPAPSEKGDDTKDANALPSISARDEKALAALASAKESPFSPQSAFGALLAAVSLAGLSSFAIVLMKRRLARRDLNNLIHLRKEKWR